METKNLELKAAIIRRFGTQYVFAQALGRPEPIVSNVIRGRLRLPDDEQVKWAKLLKADPKVLFAS